MRRSGMKRLLVCAICHLPAWSLNDDYQPGGDHAVCVDEIRRVEEGFAGRRRPSDVRTALW